MAEMTDNEIIKALEICSTKGGTCKNCPCWISAEKSKCRQAFKGAVNLINRQKEELEKANQLIQENKVLKSDNETLRKYIEQLQIGKKEGADNV